MSRAVWPGRPHPLGASSDGEGVNFALFSRHATRVELCLFDAAGSERESERIALPERTDMVWHGYLPGLKPGQLYGFRVHGPWEPEAGHRFNSAKLLLDPYAREIGRDLRWDDAMYGYALGDPAKDLARDGRDNAGFAPLAAVAGGSFDWEGDAPPRVPWHKTLIYELHVKGFTKRHPGVPERERGTYAGLGSRASIEHLRALGVTAVELMPVHHRVDDRRLVERGLCDYWGYNTLAYFAPESRYACEPASARDEFRVMVKSLHAAGIEVILDVVYNHTAEGSHLGPTLSFRGIDNRSYYRLVPEQARYCFDFTGCGNSLNMREPRVLQLIMDSLRYWAVEMRVDGFRFDLASTLARELFEVDHLSAFFDIIHQDPVLSQVKLIAEPWDLGQGGYQVGNFPVGWAEWNGRYRDAARRLWRGDAQGVSELATRLCGSSDLYEQSGRRPYASVNFVTCHDGFTLEDLVSYERKRNEANGEENRDGADDNLSVNCGVEGPTDDPAVLEPRERLKRDLLATLLLSQGVPMLSMGDELSRSQRGNNNAYCQDNELSWVDWSLDERRRLFLDFVRRLCRLRASEPVLTRRKFLQGRGPRGAPDVSWLDAEGAEMTEEAWSDPRASRLTLRLAGDGIDDRDERGRPVYGDTLAILINAGREPAMFSVPDPGRLGPWRAALDTADPAAVDRPVSERSRLLPETTIVVLASRSAALPQLTAVGATAAATGLEGARALLRHKLERAFVPASTYRLQLNGGFGFADAAAIVPYLDALGAHAVYLSPFFKAQPGSLHGYDVVDPNLINPELGGWREFEELCARLRAAGIRAIADIVPNHMGIAGDANRFWRDLLENGPNSSFAFIFDVDWEPPKPELRGKVLLPVLGDLFGRVLESRQIRLEHAAGRFQIACAGARYPIAPSTVPLILEQGAHELERLAPPAELREYKAVAAIAAEGYGEKAARRLAALTDRSPEIRRFVESRVELFNGVEGRPSSLELLERLLDRQHYRLAFWRVASDEINYRRFFDINTLAAVRTEDERVFELTHRLIFQLVSEGKIHGLRIDHPDGLYDPPGYFARLQERYLREELASELPNGQLDALLREEEFRDCAPLFVVVEKILDRREALPPGWRVHGTVGYEALNALNGLFVERVNESKLDAVYEEFIGHKIDFERLIHATKRRFAHASMAGEIETLGHRLDSISEKSRRYRDFTRASLTTALREILDCFPVYRTYVAPGDREASEEDARVIRVAVEKAKSANPRADPEVFEFLRRVLTLELEAELPEEQKALYRDFVLRFQQLTAPVMAKGLEDTAFYIDNRLLSLNEVGGGPAHFGLAAGEFHRQNVERARRWPRGLLAGSTHDTKRSEDARLRIDTLSEIPDEWKLETARWALVNEKHKTELGGALEPSRNTEYFLYQTLIGAWPDGEPDGELERRLWSVTLKSIREAKLHTDWIAPNAEYEEAVRRFLMALLQDAPENPFLRLFAPFQRKISRWGKFSALSALALRLGMPGVLDCYQGGELWDYSLVDPDNRRPVDYARRREALSEIQAALRSGSKESLVERLWERLDEGLLKLHLLREGLLARRSRPELFVGADYLAVHASGPMAEHIVAFTRRAGRSCALAAGARFFSRLPDPPVGACWEGSALELPEGLSGRVLSDLFTGRRLSPIDRDGKAVVPAQELFARLPAALLIDET